MSDQQQPTQNQAPSSSTSRQIVGSEGLGASVAAVAQQISSLEKATGGEISALRTESNLQLSAIKSDIARIEKALNERETAHSSQHSSEQKAVELALKTSDGRHDANNEWREESKQRMETYPTKNEVDAGFKRLEGMITRNVEDLRSFDSATNSRLKPLEQAKASTSAIMAAAIALIGLTATVIGIIAYFLR